MPVRPQFVLDLDLDVFVHPVVDGNGDAEYRADSAEHEVDPEAFVLATLAKLRLSPEAKIPGAFFDHHREAYYHWRDLIRTGRLRTPFDVIHVDAHSDLGNGAGLHRLFETWPTVSDKLNSDPQVNSANYLAYALANGWVRALANVRRPDSPDDVLAVYFKDMDPRSGYLTMKRFSAGEVARTCMGGFADARFEPLCEVMYAAGEISRLPTLERPPDFAFVARSPAFTPIEIDHYIAGVRSCLAPL